MSKVPSVEKSKKIYVYGIVVTAHGTILDQSPVFGPFVALRFISTTLLDDAGNILFKYDFRNDRWRLGDGSDWGFTDVIIIDEGGVEEHDNTRKLT